MTAEANADKPYERLLSGARIRASKVKDRSLDEEADADRGRVLFCAPFRRLQNKAQVFSLETNAAVRSRLTHSLEVSSIGRYVAQQAVKALKPQHEKLGIVGKERALITFVETACLLHDLGNPPFGHFGEIAISDWFHLNSDAVKPKKIAGTSPAMWEKLYTDFRQFDGNPQGFRICTKLQPSATDDLTGLNLTATTLAATLKYPWDSTQVGESVEGRPNEILKKAGYFHSEQPVIDWIRRRLGLKPGRRHPLVYLMEAADDIAYCVSDIEDGIEKGLVSGPQFGRFMTEHLEAPSSFADAVTKEHDKDANAIVKALAQLQKGPGVERLTAMRDFRSGVIRLLVRQAGAGFKREQAGILEGRAPALLREGKGSDLLGTLKKFAETSLYSSGLVRNREITAQAVLAGLLDAYLPIMSCELTRFEQIVAGERKDSEGRPIARESSLMARISEKYRAVYGEAVSQYRRTHQTDIGAVTVNERILRMRLIVDHVTGMTDEFALQTFQLISGAHINPHRN